MPIQPLGDMQAKYNEYIQGCMDHYSSRKEKPHPCQDNDAYRLRANNRQPQSMRNYTKTGFTKIKAPEHVYKLLKDFWDKNRGKEILEEWEVGSIYVYVTPLVFSSFVFCLRSRGLLSLTLFHSNNWVSPSYMLSVENEALEGGGYVLKQHIWNAARDTMEAWTGYKQAECSLYGIRIYQEGAMLAPHADDNPLVTSGILNVAQDVDEPWPLEVIGHDGKAHNVTMEPGDLVLYESHSIIHSRPFPLKGRFMANVFIHFEPYQKIGGPVELTGDLPPYVIPGSPHEAYWRATHPEGHQLLINQQFTTGSTEAHQHAGTGNIKELEKVLDQYPHLVNARDANGWTPLHEAIRIGDVELVKLVLDRGGEMNRRVGVDGDGGSPLWMAKNHDFLLELQEKDDKVFVERYEKAIAKVAALLEERGAVEYKPEHGEL